MDTKLREEILEHAHEILNDEILLSALIEAGDKNLGSKIVDLRSIAMQKMDGELKKIKRFLFSIFLLVIILSFSLHVYP